MSTLLMLAAVGSAVVLVLAIIGMTWAQPLAMIPVFLIVIWAWRSAGKRPRDARPDEDGPDDHP